MTLLRNQAVRDEVARVFAEEDVARCYYARPPYAPALYQRLLEATPGRGRALDLGCGPGKVAVALADHFDEVVALDPSEPMLTIGREADAGRHPNIAWALGKAESYDDARDFDLVTAGTSIHWPDHAVLFPRLALQTPLLAVIVQNDLPEPPCGDDAWLDFLQPWLARMAEQTPDLRRPYDPAGLLAEGTRHEAWMDIAGREVFAHSFRQSLADFITCQHSRAAWSRAAMGELAAEFDAELAALMGPFTAGGMLSLALISELTWGAPRTTPRA